MNKILKLVYKKNNETNKKEWALVSKSEPSRVLKLFGTKKPTKDEVLKEERRVQWFKSRGEEIVKKIQKISSDLYDKGIIHLADALTVCTESLFEDSKEQNVLKLSKIINLLNKKGESSYVESLSSLIPDILELDRNSCFDIQTSRKNVISAKRAYNIVKLLKQNYLDGKIDENDFEYANMKELKMILKAGFLLKKPISYKEIPFEDKNWWDHFNKRV